MILSHQDGEAKRESLKALYPRELELDCLNSEFVSPDKMKLGLAAAMALSETFPHRVALKESEFHEQDSHYFECSVFCYENEVREFTQSIEDFGLHIDIIHED
jgi:hypothetical protein